MNALRELLTKSKEIPKDCSAIAWEFEGKKREIIYFQSLGHLIKTCDDKIKDGEWPDENSDSDGDKDWRFGSLKDRKGTAESLITSTPTKMVLDKVEEVRTRCLGNETIKSLMEQSYSIKRHRKFSDFGDELDIDRILCGDPNHWSLMTKGRKRNIVKLGINLGLSCGNNETEFANIAAITTVASDLLSRAGVSVEVIGYFDGTRCTDWTSSEQIITFPIKKANDPMQLYKIACLSAPGLLRSYLFDVMDNIFEGVVSSGKGRPMEPSKQVLKELDIQYSISKSWTEDGQQEYMLEKIFKDLKRMTGVIEHEEASVPEGAEPEDDDDEMPF